jgi:uncharacterized membrane protein YphA (DoxX/SURF4 family)
MSAGRRLRRPLADRRIALVLRLAAGALLIYASHDRLLDPQPFADAIDDYRVLPFALVNFVALALPWVELVTGACLMLGLGTPGAGLVTAALAAVYTGVIAAALLRGLEIGCGCFDDETGTLLSWSDLWLRLALLVAGVQITMAARFLEWPLGTLLTRARQGRHVTGPTLGP